MLQVICDICKRSIPEAVRTYTWETKVNNYRVILDKAICYECMDDFDEEVKKSLDGQTEYGFLEYNRKMKEILERMTR